MSYCFRHDTLRVHHGGREVCPRCEAERGNGKVAVRDGRERWVPGQGRRGGAEIPRAGAYPGVGGAR